MLRTNDPQAQILDAESVAGHPIKPARSTASWTRWATGCLTMRTSTFTTPITGRHSVQLAKQVQLRQSLEHQRPGGVREGGGRPPLEGGPRAAAHDLCHEPPPSLLT